jgi:zinc protease
MVLLALLTGCAREKRPVSTLVVLPNGLTVIAKENRASDIVSLQAWVRDGALYETPGETGAAALLSRMLFEGSADGGTGDVVRTIEGMGGSLSVTPSYDFVSYAITAPAEHYDRAVGILADKLMKPSLTPEHIEAKKKSLISDWAKATRRPMNRAIWTAFKAMLGDHPYGRPSLGAPEALERITVETLRERHAARYVPGNIVIVAAGSIDPSHAMERIERVFSAFPAGAPPQGAPAPVQWPSAPVRLVEREDVTGAYEAMVFPAPSVQDPDNVIMDLILMVLGRGRSSRLHRVLVEERRLVEDVQANWATRTQPSPFIIWMDLSSENARPAEDAVLAVLRSLVEHPVDGAELAKAKTLLESEILFDNETAEGQAFYYGYWTILGGTGFVDDYLARIKSATTNDLTRVARLYLDGTRYAAAVVLPRSAEEP